MSGFFNAFVELNCECEDDDLSIKNESKEPKLNKPMRGDVKKYKVFVRDSDTGNVKKVNFGDPNMEIKRDDPKRRKSFRARHKCKTAKDKTTPRYWSCRFWGKNPVSKMLEGNFYESFISENLEDWENEWVRYTSEDHLFINKNPWHQDPAGIYFFPKSFKTQGSWHRTNKYIITAKLKRGANVLDLGKLSQSDKDKIYEKLQIEKKGGFWEGLRSHYLGKQVKFANDLRKLGYDAIFDDTKTIHGAEIQLVVLDPKFVEVVSIERTVRGTDLIEDLTKAIKKEFHGWKVSEEKFSTRKEYGKKIPQLKFVLSKGDLKLDIQVTHSEISGKDYSPTNAYARIYSYSSDKENPKNTSLEVNYGSWDTIEDVEKKLKEYSKKVNDLVVMKEDEDYSIYTDKEGKHWGQQGAGGLFYCKDTDRYLVAHRSKYVNEPNTWGTWGGSIEPNENPEEALKREIKEETGYSGDYTLKHVFTYSDNDFKFHNYIIEVPEEFEPKHSWETQGHKWVKLEDIPEPMHFGLKSLLPHLNKQMSESRNSSPSYKFKKYSGTMYHGSVKPISSWTLEGSGQFGKGLYLALDKEWAEFHAKGGRQGAAGQKLDQDGFVYEFNVKGNALVIEDEERFFQDFVSEYEPAGEEFQKWGEYTAKAVTRLLAQWAREETDADLVIFNPKKSGILTPFPQAIILKDGIAVESEKISEVTSYHGTNKSFRKFSKTSDVRNAQKNIEESGKKMERERKLHATSPSLEGILNLIKTKLYQPEAELVPDGEGVWNIKNSLSKFGLPILPGVRIVEKKGRYRYEMGDRTEEELEAIKEAKKKKMEWESEHKFGFKKESFLESFIGFYGSLQEQPNVAQSAPVPPAGPTGPSTPAQPEKANQKRMQMGKKANSWLKEFGRIMPNVSRELQTGNMGQNASTFFTMLAQMPKQDWYKFFFKL